MAFTKTIADFDDVELAPGGSALVDPSGINIVTGFAAQFYAGSGFDITGNAGPINVLTKEMGSAYIQFDASGSVGNVSVESQRGGQTYVSGSADSFGNILVQDLQLGSGSAYAELYARSGGFGDITVVNTSVDGSAEVDVSAFGGNIGNISAKNTAAKGHADVSASVSGGNIGNVYAVNSAASGSSYIVLSAHAELVGGSAEGGNIGDITLVQKAGSSGDLNVSAYAYGEASGGVYEGGGNIGNINLRNKGGASSEVSVYAYAYSGGSVGSITIRQDLQKGDYSASADVSAGVYGLGDRIAAIGDVFVKTIGNRGGDNSGRVDLNAYDGGDIGNIRLVHDDKKGNSGQNDVDASAWATASGGGNIGDVYLKNNSHNGENDVSLFADTSIGNITMINTGTGSGDNDLYLSGSANVGDIALSFGKKHVFDGGSAYLNMENGASEGNIGNITVNGGTQASVYSIGEYYGSGAIAESIASVNFSQFNGSADIDLDGVTLGTTIYASRNGSYIDGTQGTDNINLGNGLDIVELANNTVEDNVFGFQLNGAASGGDVLQLQGFDEYLGLATTNPGASTEVGENDVIALIDIAGNEDITTEVGLLAALNGGEFGNYDADTNSTATFITAANGSSTQFFVFEAVESTGDGAYDSVNLVGIVNADGTLSQLDSSNLNIII